MGKIWENYWLNGKPNVTPETNCLDYFVNEISVFSSIINRIINRYSFDMDSEIFRVLHKIVNSKYLTFAPTIHSIRKSDIEHSFPRISILGNYLCKPDIEEYQAIIDLYNWCVSEHKNLNNKIQNIKYSPIVYIANKRNSEFPKCKIPQDILINEIQILEKYREKI